MGKNKNRHRGPSPSSSPPRVSAPPPPRDASDLHAEAQRKRDDAVAQTGESPGAVSVPTEVDRRMLTDAFHALAEAKSAYEKGLAAARDRCSAADSRLAALDARERDLDARYEGREDELRKATRTRSDELDERASRLDERESKLDERETVQQERKEKLDLQELRLRAGEQALNERTWRVQDLEAKAEAGFAERARAVLGDLEAALATRREELAALTQREAEARRAWDAELLAGRSNLSEELAQRRAAWTDEETRRRRVLDDELAATRAERLEALRAEAERARATEEKAAETRRAALDRALADRVAEAEKTWADRAATLDGRASALDERDVKLQAQLRQLALDRQILELDRQAQDEKVLRLNAEQLQTLRDERRAAEARLAAVERDRERLQARVDAHFELERRLGNEAPEAVIARLAHLEAENTRLTTDIAQRPHAAMREQLEQLESRLRQAEQDRFELDAQRERLRRELDTLRRSQRELEGIRLDKESAEAMRDTLAARIEDLKAQLQELTARNRDRNPFPRCEAIDLEDEAMGDGGELPEFPAKSLADFCVAVRHRMVTALDGRRLYYSERDVRCFVAGLHMSRLLLLEGISGTGKSSLPQAFARSIGAEVAVVEVQAGWKDRHDLLGHYNAFEHRFYESPLLKALYEAGSPRFRDRPYLIVLDEMNLSHVEQYFATFLSLLERAPGDQWLELIEQPPARAPLRLRDGRLALPDNVWFIGTANQDETTNAFADKTYDRAHVMPLPRQRDVLQPKPRPELLVGLPAMRQRFADAEQHYGNAVEVTLERLEKRLGERLERDFGVGWGNRLEKQARAFGSVVRAADGSVREAMDHLLATKVLRKVCNRYEIRSSRIAALRDELKRVWEDAKVWPSQDPTGAPERCVALLNLDLRRKQSEDEDESAGQAP